MQKSIVKLVNFNPLYLQIVIAKRLKKKSVVYEVQRLHHFKVNVRICQNARREFSKYVTQYKNNERGENHGYLILSYKDGRHLENMLDDHFGAQFFCDEVRE